MPHMWNPGKIFEPWKIDENSPAHLRLMEPGKDQRSFSGNANGSLTTKLMVSSSTQSHDNFLMWTHSVLLGKQTQKNEYDCTYVL